MRDTKSTKKCGSQIFYWADVGEHGGIVSDMAWHTGVTLSGVEKYQSYGWCDIIQYSYPVSVSEEMKDSTFR